jgi:hypothetical protein
MSSTGFAWKILNEQPAAPKWQIWGAAGLAGMAILGTAIKVYQARQKDRGEIDRRSPLDLEGCLHVLHAAILAMKGLPYQRAQGPGSLLRVTIHRVNEDAHTVEQIVPYVGDESGGQGRRFSSRSGVVGRAITTREPAMLTRLDESFESYIHTLTTQWAMPEEEALRLTRDRFAFLAIPLTGAGNKVIGVLFLDSSDKEFFSEPLVGGITTACVGLAQYAKLRYGS